jgi:hypothetical protein
MSGITPSEFEEWQNHFITKEFMSAILTRIEDAKEILSYSAGKDQLEDSFMRGFIHAFREALEFKVENQEEE